MTGRRSKIGLSAMAAAVVLVMSACGAGGGSPSGTATGGLADMEPITLSYNTVGPASGSTGEVVVALVDHVAEASGGKITIEPYYSSSLLAGPEALSGVGAGVADMTYLGVSYYPQDLPLSVWYSDVSGVRVPRSAPHAFLAGSAAATEVFLGNADVQREMESQNIKLLAAHWGANGYDLMCNQPIPDAASLEGRRVRVGGDIWAEQATALGMVPQFTPFVEIYESLQRGVVDCALQGPPSVSADAGWFEVAPHFAATSFASLPGNIHVINLDMWNSLPVEAQQIIQDGFLDLEMTFLENAIQGYADFARTADEQGITFHDPAQIDTALDASNDGIIEELVANAPAGMTDPQGVVDRSNEVVDEWTQRITGELGIPERPKTREGFLKLDGFDISGYAELMTQLHEQYRAGQ